MNITEAESIIKTAVSNANTVVYETAINDVDLEGMGTTLVSVFISDDTVIAANVGDSRLYMYKNNTLKQVTNDHSFVQFLIDKGSIKPEDAKNHPNKNIILRALGVNENVEPDIFILNNNDFDILLLCSDGLTSSLNDEDILEIIQGDTKKKTSLKKKAEMLVEKANIKGGVDNITAVLISKD